MFDLIFDLDGCLIDSKEVQKSAFFGSYQKVVGDGKCPTYDEYIKHTGDSIDNVLKKMRLPAEMAAIYRKISSESIDKIIVNWEALALVKELHSQGSKIAIVTGKDSYRTVEILNYYKINSSFDALICSDDVEEPKPSPVPMLEAIKQLKSKKERVIAIGDGYNDILSAKRAGIKSILTLWYGDTGVPREADYVVYTINELKNVIYQGCCEKN